MDYLTLIQNIAPAVALYAAIRADLARVVVRLDHIERDMYKSLPPLPRN